MLKVGDEVYLSDEGIKSYLKQGVPKPENLIWIKGVVSMDNMLTLSVEWENGHSNNYTDEDLIKVTQEKPVVIGYKQIGHKGVKWDDDEFQLMSEKEMKVESEFDLKLGFAKAKFRPVYEV